MRPNRSDIDLAGLMSTKVEPAGSGRSSACSEDERALAWDLAGDRRLIRSFDAGPPFFVDPGDRSPRGIAVSPDGHCSPSLARAAR